jgi:SIR2-like protein
MPMIPNDLFDAVKSRQCVLFLGAGVHYPPPDDSGYTYPEAERPPLGDAFSRQLAEESIAELDEETANDSVPANVPANEEAELRWKQKEREEERTKKRKYLQTHAANLQRTSWYYEVHRDRARLLNKINAAVKTGRQPSPIVRALAEIDFPVVITTNYDQLFEKALRLVGKDPIVGVYEPTTQPAKYYPGSPQAKEPWLFKIHGCISDPASIVITDEDYIHFVMRMADPLAQSPVPLKISVQFNDWPTLFVGYSLLDYNLRLLFRTLRNRVDLAERPPTFSLDPLPDMLVVATYGAPVGTGASAPLVSFIEQNSWRFVPELYQRLFDRQMPK